MESIYLSTLSVLAPTWWLWKGLSYGILVYLFGKFLVAGVKEHQYLLDSQDRHQLLTQLAKLLEPKIEGMNFGRYKSILEKDLRRAGLIYSTSANHFLAKQLVIAIATFSSTMFLFFGLLGMPFLLCVVSTLIAFALPYLKIHDLATQRFISSSKDLPFFVDYLALSMDAGLDFSQGLNAVVADAPKSPVTEEFSVMLKNMRLGVSREQGLNDLQKRMDSPGIRIFAQTLTQAMKVGSDVVQTLHVMSDTMRINRFQGAEEMAGKISVRMMIPMMIFVLPATVIMLLGPIVLEWVLRM